MAISATINAVRAYGDFLITNNENEAIILGLYDRSKVNLRAATAWLGHKMIHWNWDKIHTKESGETREFLCYHFPVTLGKTGGGQILLCPLYIKKRWREISGNNRGIFV